MERRNFIKTAGASAAGAAAVLGTSQPVAAGNFEYGAYSEYGYLKFTPSEGSAGNPTVLALHGCTQEPSDFAEAIQVDYWGDEFGYNFVFPNQNDLYNFADCWNWYYDYNCDRGSGSGYELYNILTNVEDELGANGKRYVGGFSAGAAFTPNLIVNYADIYDAACIHSGTEYDAAETATGGTGALNYGGPDPYDQAAAARDQMESYGILGRTPTIVFQGTADGVVDEVNGDQAAKQAAATCYYGAGGGVDYTFDMADTTTGSSGKSYTRHQFRDANGKTNVDYWNVDGLEHDWSGGSASRIYADPDAPEATYHMLEFFEQW